MSTLHHWFTINPWPLLTLHCQLTLYYSSMFLPDLFCLWNGSFTSLYIRAWWLLSENSTLFWLCYFKCSFNCSFSWCGSLVGLKFITSSFHFIVFEWWVRFKFVRKVCKYLLDGDTLRVWYLTSRGKIRSLEIITINNIIHHNIF